MVDELREAVAVDLGSVSVDRLAPGASGAKAFLADSRSFMFGAYIDHGVAGGVWGATIRHPGGGITVEVRELYVLGAARRRGIGTLLIESSMSLARRVGATAFEVRLPADDPGSGIGEACRMLGSAPGLSAEQWML